jgi:hypothetical protein
VKDARITRSFGVNAALKALELAGGDRELAKNTLMTAVDLAYIPAFYAFGDKTVTDVAPKAEEEPAVSSSAPSSDEPTI